MAYYTIDMDEYGTVRRSVLAIHILLFMGRGEITMQIKILIVTSLSIVTLVGSLVWMLHTQRAQEQAFLRNYDRPIPAVVFKDSGL